MVMTKRVILSSKPNEHGQRSQSPPITKLYSFLRIVIPFSIFGRGLGANKPVSQFPPPSRAYGLSVAFLYHSRCFSDNESPRQPPRASFPGACRGPLLCHLRQDSHQAPQPA